MGLRVEITLPPKYYKEQIAKAKKAGDMKKVEKLKESLKLKREQDLKVLEEKSDKTLLFTLNVFSYLATFRH